MKKKFVTKTTAEEISYHWGQAPNCWFTTKMFVKCNKDGKINWHTTAVYTQAEVNRDVAINVVDRA